MKSYFEILNTGKEMLKVAGVDDYNIDAWLLFEHVFGMKRTEYFIKQNQENYDEAQENKFYELIAQRVKRKPLQHITGHQEFMGIDFKVNEHTLIPRQDTETLVEKVLEEAKAYRKESGKATLNILDMCTGSGCIGISIGKLLDNVHITAVDISKEALKVAKENAIINVLSNIRFIEGNLFDKLNEEKYDIIVSNPPYIRTSDIYELMEEVRIFEPISALDGEADGLIFYKKITEKSRDYLEHSGRLLYEIGFDQGKDVENIMITNGYKDISIIKDLSGLDRVVKGKLHH